MEKIGKLLAGLVPETEPVSKDEQKPKVPARAYAADRAQDEKAARARKRLYRPSSAPTPVTGILSKILAKHGLDQEIERYKFVQHWSEIVGEKVAAITKPECIRSNTLIVRVPNSTWAQELSFLKEDVLEKLRPFLTEDQEVSDVMFRVK